MKPSSTDPVADLPGRRTSDSEADQTAGPGNSVGAGSSAGPGSSVGLTALQVIAGDEAQVRPIRFDQALRSGSIARLGWADQEIEQRLERAAREAREQARSVGYAEGWAQGRQVAAEQARIDAAKQEIAVERALQDELAQIHALLETLAEACRVCTLAMVPAWTEFADAITDGALAIARAALGRELTAVDSEAADAVRTALRALAGASEITVHVHPDDLRLLRRLVDTELPAHVRLVEDPQLSPGGVLAVTPVQRLHRDLPTALARAEEVLRT
jgi:flagellar assembly protein FliH